MAVNIEEKTKLLTPQEAVFEASRCIECESAPCVKACPLGVDIPRFVGRIKMGDFIGANRIIKEKCVFSGICGHVCPVEKLCVQSCCITEPLGPVKINQLQRFVAEYEMNHKEETKEIFPKRMKKNRVGIVGAGPAGLSAAFWLAEKGYEVTVYEAKELPGGMMTYGIPPYRLPRETLLTEINDRIRELAIEIRTNNAIGMTEQLKKEYDSLLIATGAWGQVSLDIPGIDLQGVHQGLDFLGFLNNTKNKNSQDNMIAGKDIAIIGGGDVAMDVAISSVNFGAKRVFLLYRRSFEEMPAIKSEVQMAKQKGVMFWIQTIPIRILGNENNNVKAIECIETKLGSPDETGRRKPIPVQGTEFQLNVDIVVEAIGQKIENKDIKDKDLTFNPNGTIKIDKDKETSIPGIFAAGDVISGGSTVVQSMAEGIEAAIAIDKYISKS
jgi:glutamate synthase (NADPH) small chain